MLIQKPPLSLTDGHLFVSLDDKLWLIDTGAPSGFGQKDSISLADRGFELGDNYLGMTAEDLSDHVGVPCVGLLGADVLGEFDHLFDLPNETLTLSSGELDHEGHRIPMELFMGIPVLNAQVGDNSHRMFFDTGAQISYFQHESLRTFPSAGTVSDFYPGVGEFETSTHEVPVTLGIKEFSLQCGQLPERLAMTLMMAGTTGIIGNVILQDRVVGYFPRRNELVI